MTKMGTNARRLAAAVLILAAAGVLTRALVSASQPVPAKNDDVLAALLVEVRGLRAAMEQMASAGPRVQLFASRLQLQEARINGMVRRLDAVRDSLASVQRDYDRARDEIKQFETALSGGAVGDDREALEQMLPVRKREAAAMKITLDRYTAEEGQLANDIAIEQGRWTEINQRLDELERALSKR
jgi:predicted  nucleic acid-binding Zn-ribbon protein